MFSKISDFIVRCMVRDLMHYLDVFCIEFRDTESGCVAQAILRAILPRQGFYISFLKVTSPATKTRFLRIYINCP